VQKTLYVEGKADSKQREKLKEIFPNAPNSSDHLIVNIRKIEEFDYSFDVLICSIRRTAQLLGIRLTIEGYATDSIAFVYECALHLRKKAGKSMLNTPAYLWESSTRVTSGGRGRMEETADSQKTRSEKVDMVFLVDIHNDKFEKGTLFL